MFRTARWIIVVCCAFISATLPRAHGATAESEVDFIRDVKPILAKRCFACHGPNDSEAGLQLHNAEIATGELDSGEIAVVPGDPDASALLYRVTETDEDLRMPPEGDPLTEREVGVLQAWIEQGAEWKDHWAFQPREPVEPPEVQDAGWVKNPIDAFVLARLEQAGLSPAPPAGKRTLIRRLYFDLIGLPPTPEEVEAFVADNSPQAYERLVDRLLASERYGERWARHWLDVVRFAETNSYERDGPKPNAWKYRDYVIRSFNSDKPYDQFLREQLAGDELDEVTRETIIATGFYRLGRWDDEPADRLLAKYDEFDDIVTVVGQGMLGLTVNCARCHDHKIDPIPQADYYRLLAFFRDLGGHGDGSRFTDKHSQVDISPPEIRALYAGHEARVDNVKARMREIEQTGIARMPAEDQRASEGLDRPRVLSERLPEFLNEEETAKYEALKAERDSLKQARKKLPPREMALGVTHCFVEPPRTHILLRGMPRSEGDAVIPGYPAIFKQSDPVIPPPAEDATTARRRQVLADWITSDSNMLTPRVAVNRVWQHHFGRGIVRSANNFGELGTPPTHPLLLDCLANDFVAGGWKLKRLHRLMVTSNTYRMSSAARDEALAVDPNNDLFWRFNPRRLSAEEIRDAILAVNGRLNLKMYGPGFYPQISEEVLAAQSMPGKGWGGSSPHEQARRSVYIHVKRSLITPLLEAFDFPETDSSCEARFNTTQPQQAFALLHGDFINAQAAAFADRLAREAEGKEAQVTRALELAMSRPPDHDYVQRSLALMDRLQSEHGLSEEAALRLICLSVYNLNEFIFLD